jgi:hypothetical protein
MYTSKGWQILNIKIHFRYAAILSFFPSLVISLVVFLVSLFANLKLEDTQFNVATYSMFIFILSYSVFFILYFIVAFLSKYVKT